LPAGEDNELEFVLPELAGCDASAHTWCDVLRSNGATVVARYTHSYYAGRPAITLNEVGEGRVVYVGTFGDADLWTALVGWLIALAELKPLLDVPQGVEVTERWQGDRRLLFVLNHTAEEQEVVLDTAGVNLLKGGSVVEGAVAIAPWDVLVLLE